jgi:hypothetical protein
MSRISPAECAGNSYAAFDHRRHLMSMRQELTRVTDSLASDLALIAAIYMLWQI